MAWLVVRIGLASALMGFSFYGCVFFAKAPFEQAASANYPSTLGLVTDSHVQVKHDGDGNGYYPSITYTYEVDGLALSADRYRVIENSDRTRAEAIVSRHPAGSQVRVYYNPKTPSKAVLDPGATLSDFANAVLAVIIGLAIGLGTWSSWLQDLPPVERARSALGRTLKGVPFPGQPGDAPRTFRQGPFSTTRVYSGIGSLVFVRDVRTRAIWFVIGPCAAAVTMLDSLVRAAIGAPNQPPSWDWSAFAVVLFCMAVVAAGLHFMRLTALGFDGYSAQVCERKALWATSANIARSGRSRPVSRVIAEFADLDEVDMQNWNAGRYYRLEVKRSTGRPITLLHSFGNAQSVRVVADELAELVGIKAQESSHESSD